MGKSYRIGLTCLSDHLPIPCLRVVRAARDKYDPAILSHVIKQKLHQKEMPQIVGCERKLVTIRAVLYTSHETCAGIANNCLKIINFSFRNKILNFSH
ncbi:hypothetical protein GCM10007426_31930 [Alloalcanivorax dieselolei]|nr:hypothetical protein GCM10007426_31930 [Alloalcanivorax dieselolei]